MKKVLMLVRTSGLEYDDRVRKESLSLIELGYQVFILANYTNNKSESGITSYGVNYRALKLRTRNILPSAKFLLLKMTEFWVRTFFLTLFKKYDYVWVHEEYMALNILVRPVKGKYIFDLHELPLFLTANDRRKSLYKKIESNCHGLIVANNERLEHMIQEGLVYDSSKYYILNNFPDNVFSSIQKLNLPKDILKDLNGSKYILMQGGGHKDRYPIEVLSAIKKLDGFKAIIVGPIDNSFIHRISTEFSDIVIIAGYVKQLELSRYIDNAWASIILYAHNSPNNIFCEPNRLYQAINRGTPVIGGNNPPISNIIKECDSGVIMLDDGKNINDIYESIKSLEKDYYRYKISVEKAKEKYSWNNQLPIIESILK